MYTATQILALGGIVFMSGSSASPLEARATAVNCNDVTTGLDPSCWAKLNMTGWFSHWAATTPGAQGSASIEDPTEVASAPASVSSGAPSSPSGFGDCGGDLCFRRRAAGCESGEPWSTCFLRLGLGHTGQDCSKINPLTCAAPKAGSPPHTAQIFYGVWNVYAVNKYISSVYSALNGLNQENSNVIRSAANEAPGGIRYDIGHGESYSVDGVLIQLLLRQTNNRSFPNSMNLPLINYLQKYPSKEKYDVHSTVDQLTSTMSGRLVDALTFLMSDIPTFIKFVENGAFSTTKLPTFEDLTKAFAEKGY